ncbi:MAG TPA: hypothetical protein VII92_11445, partial [Anaerolineae bacterium]
MDFPFLTVITFTPIVAAVILLLLPSDKKTLLKTIALIATAICLALSIVVFVTYDQQAGATDPARQFQFQEQVERDEHAEHARHEQHEEGEELARAILDAPRDHHSAEGDDAGQQDHRQVD